MQNNVCFLMKKQGTVGHIIKLIFMIKLNLGQLV